VDNIKIDLVEIGWSGVNWISLSQDKYKCRDFVNAAMNLRFHKMLGNSRVAVEVVASMVELRYTELVS
jgi:hypothetical protein